MQKKWFKGMAAVMAAAALAGAFAGCGGDKKAAQSGAAGQTVKFGFVTAYTGPGAAYGQAMKEGVDLAVEEINKDPKTKMKIDLVTYDTKLNKAEAINAVKKCIEQDKVLAIEGPMTSGEMFAAGPVAQQSKVVAFGTGTTAPGILYASTIHLEHSTPRKCKTLYSRAFLCHNLRDIENGSGQAIGLSSPFCHDERKNTCQR